MTDSNTNSNTGENKKTDQTNSNDRQSGTDATKSSSEDKQK